MMRTPSVTMTLTGVVVALFALAGHPDALLLHPGDGAAQPWRWVTAHFVHLSLDHLTWDALAFVVLGSALELQSRRRLLAVLLAATISISGFLVLAHPEMPAYAGLSGVDAALTAAVAVQLWHAGSADRKLGTILGLAFLGKLVAEQLTGGVLFAGDAAQHAVSVHAVGALVGGAVAAATPFRAESGRPSATLQPLVAGEPGG